VWPREWDSNNPIKRYSREQHFMLVMWERERFVETLIGGGFGQKQIGGVY
jgi:hypothetical protein